MTSTAHATARPKRAVRRGEHKAQRAQASPAARVLARCGLVSRGGVYLILGYLTADVAATGGRGKNASSQGVFVELIHQPAGPLLVTVASVGFLSYAVWRLLEAAAGDEREARGSGALVRIGWAGIGVVYLLLAADAVLVVIGASNKGDDPFSFSRALLEHEGGAVLLGAIAVGIIAGGLGLAIWAVLQAFADNLHMRRIPEGLRAFARGVETFGNATRGLVFAGIGASMLVAAASTKAQEAKGLNGTLHTLAHERFGVVILAVAAAGFVAFGLASWLETKYRDVDPKGDKGGASRARR